MLWMMTNVALAQPPALVQAMIDAERAGKHLTASQGLWDLLERDVYPTHEGEIRYHLARSLRSLGQHQAAQRQLLLVVVKNPSSTVYPLSVAQLVDIAEDTGNDAELVRVVDRIDASRLPEAAAPRVAYLQGQRALDKGQLRAAYKAFGDIPAEHALYPSARFHQGVIRAQRDEPKQAARAFVDVARHDDPELRDLAVMNLARLHFALQGFHRADNYYDQVPRLTTHWPKTLFEQSWTSFYQDDFGRTLGNVLTLNSPVYSSTEFFPETAVLESLVAFSLCEYDQVDAIVAEFEQTYTPMVTELTAELAPYKAEGAPSTDEAWQKWFVDGGESSLAPAIFARALRNQDLAGAVRTLDRIESEQAALANARTDWQAGVGRWVAGRLEKDRIRYEKRAGRVLLKELDATRTELEGLLVEASTVRFEAVDAQRRELEEAAHWGIRPTQSRPDPVYGDAREIVWPFNGEFWRDELGGYRYELASSCGVEVARN